jgi:glucose dehydrogenase
VLLGTAGAPLPGADLSGGVLIALNASSGAVLWRFNTVAGPEPGVQSLGLGSGGAWETPLVRGDGSVTYGIGNPYQTPTAAIAHPAVELYTDSDVNLDAATGKLRWYYQGVPDDFKDYDMQASPISARIGGVSVVIGSGKMGYVYEMNASTGVDSPSYEVHNLTTVWLSMTSSEDDHVPEDRNRQSHQLPGSASSDRGACRSRLRAAPARDRDAAGRLEASRRVVWFDSRDRL